MTVSRPDKLLYPDEGITKADVAAYYRTVAPRLLPFLEDRPVTLERLPDGLGEGKPHFWQKNTPASYPAWVPRAELATGAGKPVAYVLVNNLPTLLYLVNQGALTFTRGSHESDLSTDPTTSCSTSILARRPSRKWLRSPAGCTKSFPARAWRRP